VESFSKLRINSLRSQIEASRLYSVELARRFEYAMTVAEKTTIARQYDKALKETHALQFLLEMLEQKQAESQPQAGSQSAV